MPLYGVLITSQIYHHRSRRYLIIAMITTLSSSHRIIIVFRGDLSMGMMEDDLFAVAGTMMMIVLIVV